MKHVRHQIMSTFFIFVSPKGNYFTNDNRNFDTITLECYISWLPLYHSLYYKKLFQRHLVRVIIRGFNLLWRSNFKHLLFVNINEPFQLILTGSFTKLIIERQFVTNTVQTKNDFAEVILISIQIRLRVNIKQDFET